ncbi:MAG: ABC transporter ATP-binding protein [Armatimonadota bacterium]
MIATDVQLNDVSKRFGDVVAVDNVSIAILRGEFFSLLGPSGCGKTTTLRVIGGFEFPTAGRVYLREQDVTRVPPNHRATNMVFQHLALFPHLNVFENIAFGLRLAGRPRKELTARVQAMLKLVELAAYEDREIRQLSGGQKQRVAIARALVNQPAVLLLDEPLGALDLKLRLQMQAELKAIQHQVGTTFVYVTHDQGEALAMSDRIAVMRDGHIEQIGTSEEIYSRPRTRFVATFIGEANVIDGVVEGYNGGSCRVAVGPLKMVGEPMDPPPPGTRVSLVVRPEHVKVGRLAEGLPNHWQGRIREITFMGPTVRYRIAIGAVVVTAEVHNDEIEGSGVDAQTAVGWQADRAILLAG